MRPIFTIHAGEFLFGEEIGKQFKGIDLWIPAKDRGIDFLVTDLNQKSAISVQVKMSRDYGSSHATDRFHEAKIAGGWFRFAEKTLQNSPADIWSLLLVSHEKRVPTSFINLEPHRLLERLRATHGEKEKKVYDLYLWVLDIPSVATGKTERFCVEGRGLKKAERASLADGEYKLGARDWTEHLGDWSMFEALQS